MATSDASDTCGPAAEPTCEPVSEPLDLTPLLDALREIDANAELVPNDTPRFCNGLVNGCLCSHHAVLHGHRINIGHASLDKLGAATVCAGAPSVSRKSAQAATWPPAAAKCSAT